jgi:hypothetical protein
MVGFGETAAVMVVVMITISHYISKHTVSV